MVTSKTHHPGSPVKLPSALTNQLIQIHSSNPTRITNFEPSATGGGFGFAWQGMAVTPPGNKNLAWVAADLLGSGGRQLIQVYAEGQNGLGLVLYKQLEARFAPGWQDSVEGEQEGQWFVARPSKANDPDLLVRAGGGDLAVKFDVYGWSVPEHRVVRLGGFYQAGLPIAFVRSWMALPSSGKLPDVIALEVARDSSYTLVRYAADNDGTYRRLAKALPQIKQVPNLVAGRTVPGGPTDIVLYDLEASSISVYRLVDDGTYAEFSRAKVPQPAGVAPLIPLLAGDLTGDQLTDILYLVATSAQRVGALTYKPVLSTYQQMVSTNDVGVALRVDLQCRAIDSGLKGQMAVVMCWVDAVAGVSMTLLMPAGTGGLQVAWTGSGLGPATETGVWLVGKLAPRP